MNIYQQFATVLAQLLGADTAVRIRIDGYMPLSIEAIGTSADGNRLISLCYYGEQNGDLMRDPDMVFEVHATTAAALVNLEERVTVILTPDSTPCSRIPSLTNGTISQSRSRFSLQAKECSSRMHKYLPCFDLVTMA